MHLEWLTPTDREGLRLWDEFLLSSPRGHYCQLSTWLKSFESYGFEFSVLIARATPASPIVGGIGVLRFGSRSLGVMTAPIGPIVEIGREDFAPALLDETVREARHSGAFLLQLQFPCSNGATIPALIDAARVVESMEGRPGLPFPTANAPNQMLWLGFPEDSRSDSWEEDMLTGFSKGTRRDIRLSQRQQLEVREPRGEA